MTSMKRHTSKGTIEEFAVKYIAKYAGRTNPKLFSSAQAIGSPQNSIEIDNI